VESGLERARPPLFSLTPAYYIQSYNRVWYKIRSDVKLGPAPLDHITGRLPVSGLQQQQSRLVAGDLSAIAGADALFFHSKTQDNNPATSGRPRALAADPLTWQYYHFRTIENGLNGRAESLQNAARLTFTEANPQLKSDKRLGWEANTAIGLRHA